MRYLVKFKYKERYDQFSDWQEEVVVFVIEEITNAKVQAALEGYIGGWKKQYRYKLLDIKPLDRI